MATPMTVRNGNASLARMPLIGLNHEKAGIRAAVRNFRRCVETELLALGGGGILVASRLNTACLALRQVMRISRILANAGEPGTVVMKEWEQADGVKITQQKGLTFEQFSLFSDKLMRHKESLDRALAALGLEKKKDIWAGIYESPVLANGTEGSHDADSNGDKGD